MVLLLAAVLTKSGKVLFSRQFNPMSRAKVEGYLTVFPKLLGESYKQHTFIENNNVRYVYQPLENLIILIVTTKNSNIIQDIETLRTLSKGMDPRSPVTGVAIPEFAESVKEEAIIDHVFDLIFAIDELVTYGGHVEPISIQQVRVNLAMESHEEKLVTMVNESKMHAAQELMKQKAKEITHHAAAAATATSVSSAAPTMPEPVQEPSPEPIRPTRPSATKSPAFASGLKLGSKNTNSLMNDFIHEDNIYIPPTTVKASKKAEEPVEMVPQKPQSPVTINIEEVLATTITRDASLESLEIKGTLSLLITDEAYKNIIIQTKSVDLSRVQISLHPTIDKQLFISQGIIKLKDAKRSFPLNNSISLLRWKVPNPDESYLPLNITCWPEPSDSSCTVNLEYEANLDMIPSLNNVNISIPLPHGSSAPTVNECVGQYTFYSKDSIFDWNPATIDENNKEGHLEFVCSNSTEEEFFPVTATFNSKSTYSTLEIENVNIPDSDAVVPFEQSVSLSVNSYTVV